MAIAALITVGLGPEFDVVRESMAAMVSELAADVLQSDGMGRVPLAVALSSRSPQ